MKIETKFYWLIIFLVFIYLFNLLSPVLGPFLFSTLLAYLADPIVDKLERRFSRSVSVLIVFLTIIISLIFIALIIIPVVGGQVQKLLISAPSILLKIKETFIPFFSKKLGIEIHGISQQLDELLITIKENIDKVPNILGQSLSWVSSSANWIITLITNLFLVPVITFYLLRDWDKITLKISDLLPRKQAPLLIKVASESNTVLAAFLRGQFMVMNALSIIYIIGLEIIGVDFGILIGFLAGWLSFIPYLGLIIGIAIATVVSYFQFGDILHPIAVIVVFVSAQMVEGTFLTPKFVGERVGLHPVAVIFAVLAGGQLAGFSGVLLALPVASILNVIIRHIQFFYQNSSLYDDSKNENI